MLDMTVAADKVTADLRIRFDRKPESKDELELMNAMKDKYGFAWKGFGDAAIELLCDAVDKQHPDA